MYANFNKLYMDLNKHVVLSLIDLVLFFSNMVFVLLLINPFLLIFHSYHGSLILLLYVDDILLTCSIIKLVIIFINFLRCEFVMKDLGLIHYFFGVDIS